MFNLLKHKKKKSYIFLYIPGYYYILIVFNQWKIQRQNADNVSNKGYICLFLGKTIRIHLRSIHVLKFVFFAKTLIC